MRLVSCPQESMSSAETPSNNKRISLSNSFSDDQGYHGSGAEHEGNHANQWYTTVSS